MAQITVNGSNSNVVFAEYHDYPNIASIGDTSFTTDALAKDGGMARLTVQLLPDLIKGGTVNWIKISYKAYGSRTGVLGSKAVIYTGYWNAGSFVTVNTHGDVGRGSSNATPYTDTITPPANYSNNLYFFLVKNPIATQTNTVYVSNISILVDYTPGTRTISTEVSPQGSGTVTGGGTYEYGTTVTLTAKPNSGYKFVKWSDGTTTATKTVTADSNFTTTAYFEKTAINNIYFGTSKPSKIYLGTQEVKEVYFGTTKVYG